MNDDQQQPAQPIWPFALMSLFIVLAVFGLLFTGYRFLWAA